MSDCGLMNLASCLPEAIYDYFIKILNSPIQPLLSLTKGILTEPIDLSLFLPLWEIILYVLSLFYSLLFLYVGFKFMISGYDAVKRKKAKENLKNILIMIVLVQMSYFLYSLTIDINAALTAGVINLIDENFFKITADNIVNIGLEFIFTIFYVLVLFLTALLLVLRYILVAVGVVFVPLGIFLYFIEPLNNYGKLILNFLGICIFVTFFDAIVLLACSKVVELSFFENFKILVMIGAFSIVNFLMFYLMFFAAIKSAFKSGESIAMAATKIGKYMG